MDFATLTSVDRESNLNEYSEILSCLNLAIEPCAFRSCLFSFFAIHKFIQRREVGREIKPTATMYTREIYMLTQANKDYTHLPQRQRQRQQL